MSGILWEMIQVDQYSVQFLDKDSVKENVRNKTGQYYNEVLQMHHVTRDDFQKSLQFYVSRPDISKVMFDSLYAQATRQRGKIYERSPKPSRVPRNPLPIKPIK